MNITVKLLHIQKSLGTKFQLKLTIFNIWTKLTQNWYFQCKNKKEGNRCQILDIRISLGSKFQLKLTIWIFWTIFAQKGIATVKHKYNVLRHWLMHIRIGLGFEFYFEHFWILGPNWLKKSIFDQKMKKWTAPSNFYIFKKV